MQNINKELPLCSQLAPDAAPGARRCLSAVGPRGGPHFTACETRITQSSGVFSPSEYRLEKNKPPNLAGVKKNKKNKSAFGKVCGTFFLFLVCLFGLQATQA